MWRHVCCFVFNQIIEIVVMLWILLSDEQLVSKCYKKNFTRQSGPNVWWRHYGGGGGSCDEYKVFLTCWQTTHLHHPHSLVKSKPLCSAPTMHPLFPPPASSWIHISLPSRHMTSPCWGHVMRWRIIWTVTLPRRFPLSVFVPGGLGFAECLSVLSERLGRCSLFSCRFVL